MARTLLIVLSFWVRAAEADDYYASYWGGSSDDKIVSIVTDRSRNLYLIGNTKSPDFPVTEGSHRGLTDIFITKLAPDGKKVLFSKLIGGVGHDVAASASVGDSDSLIIVGTTGSKDFPVSLGAMKRTRGGTTDGFILVVSSSGESTYSSYIGGSGNDSITDVAFDTGGRIWIVGETNSPDITVTDNSDYKSNTDVFVQQIDYLQSSILYGSYVGGSGNDAKGRLDLWRDRVSFAFETDSQDIPAIGGGSGSNNPSADIFLGIIGADGALQYSSRLGGGGVEWLRDLSVDREGHIFVIGTTWSSDFPVTPAAMMSQMGGTHDGFVTKLNIRNGAIECSTFIGGPVGDGFGSALVDSRGINISGYTWESGFPTTDNATQSTGNGLHDAVFALMSSDCTDVSYATYFGGSGNDFARTVDIGRWGHVYLAGETGSKDIRISADAVQSMAKGGLDAWFAIIDAQ